MSASLRIRPVLERPMRESIREAVQRYEPFPMPRSVDEDLAHQRGLYLLRLINKIDELMGDTDANR